MMMTFLFSRDSVATSGAEIFTRISQLQRESHRHIETFIIVVQFRRIPEVAPAPHANTSHTLIGFPLSYEAEFTMTYI